MILYNRWLQSKGYMMVLVLETSLSNHACVGTVPCRGTPHSCWSSVQCEFEIPGVNTVNSMTQILIFVNVCAVYSTYLLADMVMYPHYITNLKKTA